MKRILFYRAERYYSEGINDPDYSVLCFTAERVIFITNKVMLTLI